MCRCADFFKINKRVGRDDNRLLINRLINRLFSKIIIRIIFLKNGLTGRKQINQNVPFFSPYCV